MKQLEICVDTIEGLAAAVEGGADRVELCSALAVGGLSPSLALLEAARACPVPVQVMVRPRDGDFLYGEEELSGMEQEIEQVRQMGLAGIVIGAGDADGLDLAALKRLCDAAQGLNSTLHRVVDLLADRSTILQPARDLGFSRILTSGGAKKAVDALSDLQRLVTDAPAGLSIMPGSGVTAENIKAILEATGAQEIHASAALPAEPPEKRLVELGFASGTRRKASAESVRQLKAAMSA
ncbi:copper homeostasis protein CutC [Rhodobacterales bacterium]|nr:copper homeostasis protein CutC [Rhodobacterales bacterium]